MWLIDEWAPVTVSHATRPELLIENTRLLGDMNPELRQLRCSSWIESWLAVRSSSPRRYKSFKHKRAYTATRLRFRRAVLSPSSPRINLLVPSGPSDANFVYGGMSSFAILLKRFQWRIVKQRVSYLSSRRSVLITWTAWQTWQKWR